MEIILSTRNPSKAQQIKALFTDSSIIIRTLTEAGIEGEAVEDGATLQENALKKATFAYERAASAIWTMADDTGIFIDAPEGESGTWAQMSIEQENKLSHRGKAFAQARAFLETLPR